MLAETRRMARDRAALAEVMAVEMTARLDIMMKDVGFISKKVCVSVCMCVCVCVCVCVFTHLCLLLLCVCMRVCLGR